MYHRSIKELLYCISRGLMCGHITPYQDTKRFPAHQRRTENLGGVV